MIAVEQLEGEPCKGHGTPRLSVTFYDLQVCRYGVVIHDVLQRRPVGNLLGGNGPFPRLLKSIGYGFAHLTYGVTCSIVGDGAVDAFGARAVAKPCVGLVFGRREAVDIGGQRADNLLRAIANYFKDNAFGRLFDAGLVAVAMVFKF